MRQYSTWIKCGSRAGQPGFVKFQGLPGQELLAGGKTRLAPRQNLPGKRRAGIRNAIAHNPDLAGKELLRVRAVVLGEHDAQVHLLHQPVREHAPAHGHRQFQPSCQPRRVPMQDHPLEKRPAQQHDQPIPVQGRPFSRGGNVIEIRDAVAETAPDGLQTIDQQQDKLDDKQIDNILELLRKPRIDMVKLDCRRKSPSRYLPPAVSGGGGPRPTPPTEAAPCSSGHDAAAVCGRILTVSCSSTREPGYAISE